MNHKVEKKLQSKDSKNSHEIDNQEPEKVPKIQRFPNQLNGISFQIQIISVDQTDPFKIE
jgi:hypothetical protein